MRTRIVLLSAILIGFAACNNEAPKEETPVKEEAPVEKIGMHPAWAVNANIYELNVRQFSEKGDLNSVLPALPRLQKMGVDILWLMPVHPIGEKNRKGGLGSYYSVKNYTEVNPEFGTKVDFQNFVDSAHALGMKVILDWVANHSAWDNPWVTEHPEWYETDSLGNMIAPYDWTDVVSFDYTNQDMRNAMVDALKYWVAEHDIDGYRCDVAYEVPGDFWDSARAELDALKPVFMLAEAEVPAHHIKAFDASYAWEFHHIMNAIAKGEKEVSAIDEYMAVEDTHFVADAYRMYFTTNHDENSWNGTVFERMGENHLAFAVLAFTLDGMPLIYSGQEAGMENRLAFFEKDLIKWGDIPFEAFYTTLLHLKKENQALWNGASSGAFEKIETAEPMTYAYKRTHENGEVLVFINFGNEEKALTTTVDGTGYTNVFNGKYGSMQGTNVQLAPHGFVVMEKH